MKKLDKFMNIFLKVSGIVFLFNTILYLLDMYHPWKITIALHMFIIGVILLFTKFTSNKKDKNKYKEQN